VSPPEAPNPERGANAPIICIGVGAGLLVLTWFFGIGGVMVAALAGGDAMLSAGGLFALIMLPLAALVGFLLVIVGGVWLFARVVADSTDAHSKERYKNVQR
jgi:hypothetical protein